MWEGCRPHPNIFLIYYFFFLLSSLKIAFCIFSLFPNKIEITLKSLGVRKMIDKVSLALVIIGALNWGGIGLFKFDLVAWIFGGQAALMSRIIYTLVALAGIWCISLLFRTDSEGATITQDTNGID